MPKVLINGQAYTWAQIKKTFIALTGMLLSHKTPLIKTPSIMAVSMYTEATIKAQAGKPSLLI